MTEEIKRIRAALYAPYDTRSGQADAVLQVINHEDSLRRRVALMAYALANMGIPDGPDEQHTTPAPGIGVSDKRWEEISRRWLGEAKQFTENLERENPDESGAARRVFAFLEPIEKRDERAVAFAFILFGPLVPYAQLPKGITIGNAPAATAMFTRPSVRQSSAMVHRILRYPPKGSVPNAVLLARILARHTDEFEIAAILDFAFHEVTRHRDHPQIVTMPLPAELSREIAAALGVSPGGESRRSNRDPFSVPSASAAKTRKSN